jgi:hypothetical protein
MAIIVNEPNYRLEVRTLPSVPGRTAIEFHTIYPEGRNPTLVRKLQLNLTGEQISHLRSCLGEASPTCAPT